MMEEIAMPMYLKRDSIRFLEASVSAISLAVTSVGLPQRYEFREESAEYAIAIGLAGVAADITLLMILENWLYLRFLKWYF